jgi:hypothetical protein
LSLHHTTTTLQHDRLQSVTTNVTRRSSVEDVLRTSYHQNLLITPGGVKVGRVAA